MLDKMPNSLEAEQAVLGSMFLSKSASEKALETLTSESFYNEANGHIFSCLEALVERGTGIDLTTVTAYLDNKKILKQIGDVEYLTEVINAVPSAANIDEYIRIVEEKATLRRLINEANNIIHDGYNSTDSLTDILDNAERKILNVVKTSKGTEFHKITDVLYKAQSDIEKLSQNKGEVTGIASGFRDIDRITSGFHANELIIIAARPGMGKTAIALNMAINMANSSKKAIALFNMEMSSEQLAMRMIASVGQINQGKVRTGRLEHNDWRRVNEAISRLADTKIFIDDTPGMTIGEIRAKCRRLASEQDGLGAIIIDYLQCL